MSHRAVAILLMAAALLAGCGRDGNGQPNRITLIIICGFKCPAEFNVTRSGGEELGGPFKKAPPAKR